jgi:AcrR family transcriptional regulator
MPQAHSGTIDRLFTAAVDLFGERGYAGATIDDIVERAGIAKGTVYYHFRSKSELVSALLDDGLRRLAASFRSEIEGAPGGGAAPRALRHPAG